eukprot:639880-Hanusia_phi.AAC.1
MAARTRRLACAAGERRDICKSLRGARGLDELKLLYVSGAPVSHFMSSKVVQHSRLLTSRGHA